MKKKNPLNLLDEYDKIHMYTHPHTYTLIMLVTQLM